MAAMRASPQSGFTLIELVMFIVIVGVGLAGVLLGVNQATAAGSDPMVRKQMLAIAQSMMEEVQLQAFTYCDPDDPAVETAASAASCTTSEAAPTPGEGRFSTPQFDNVMDYNGYSMSPVVDITNSSVAGLSGYSASVSVQTAALGTIAAGSGDALKITVTVNGPNGATFTLDGWRTRYAPNAAP